MQRTISGKINVTFLVTLCLIGASIRLTNAAECGACMEKNYAYCINTTHFYPCYDGINPTRDQAFNCPEDSECTDHEDICIQKAVINATGSGIKSVCAGSGCNTCATTNPKLACVSKTQFSLCLANRPLAAAQSCGPNEICHLESLAGSSKSICVPESVANFLQYQSTCSNDVTTPIPIDPTPAPVYTGIATHCKNECTGKPTNELCTTFHPNSEDCKSYIGCEFDPSKATYDFFILQCPVNQFWKTTGGGCSTDPCIKPTTTTAATPPTTTTTTIATPIQKLNFIY